MSRRRRMIFLSTLTSIIHFKGTVGTHFHILNATLGVARYRFFFDFFADPKSSIYFLFVENEDENFAGLGGQKFKEEAVFSENRIAYFRILKTMKVSF